MERKSFVKRSLAFSILSLLICISMLLGTTYAWFTDTVTSSNNKIESGTLTVDLELLDKQTGWASIKENSAPLFNYEKWEPGYTDVKILKIENEGTLALKWKAQFVSANELTALADVIDVYVLPSSIELGYPDDLYDYQCVGTVRDFVNTIESTTYGTLAGGEEAYLGIALRMRSDAGNEYQGLDLGGAIDIKIVAGQMAAEEDSFGDDYDVDADYISATAVADKAALLTAASKGGSILFTNNIEAGSFGSSIQAATEFDLGGKTFTTTGIGTIKTGFSMKNGTVETKGGATSFSQYFDIRPTEDVEYRFTDVTFLNNYKGKTTGSWTDRVEYALKVTPMATGIKTTFIFENCTFDNAGFQINGLSGNSTELEVVFKNCTFNALIGSDEVISIKNYVVGTVIIEDCTFNLSCTYQYNGAIEVSNSSSTNVTVTATNNTLIANKATAHTYNPELGETERDNVKVYSNVVKYCFFDYRQLTGGYSTVNETGTVFSGDCAVASLGK